MLTRVLFVFVMLITLASAIPTAQAQNWTAYNPGQGTLPQSQGFILHDSGGSPTPTVSGGILNQGLTSYTGGQYWERSDVSFNFANDFTIEATLKVISSTYVTPSPNGGVPDSQRAGYYLNATDSANRTLSFGIASGGITLNTDHWGSASNGVTFKSFNTTDTFHQYRLVVTQGVASVYIDSTIYGSTPIGSAISGEGVVANQVWFADGTGAGSSQTQLAGLRYAPSLVVIPESCTALLLLTGGVIGIALLKASKFSTNRWR